MNAKVIKIGSCTLDPGNVASPVYAKLKNQLGVGGGSTVTLIREGEEVLVVDTGYDREADGSQANREKNWYELKLLLGFHGVAPTDITKVFITHFHRDHFGGIEHLAHAQWYCHRLALADCREAIREKFLPVDDGQDILPNVVAIHTPGHTRGHCSLLWTAKDRSVRVAISGDAIINLAWLQSGYIWRWNSDFYNREEARGSIEKLLRMSDIVIPGHGQPFFSSLYTGRRPFSGEENE